MILNVRSLLICALILFYGGSFAQKKKEVRKFGIRTVISTKTVGTKTVNDEKLSFNNAGLLTEEIHYDDNGLLTSYTKYRYNLSEDVIEESEYDKNNVLIEKRTMLYNSLAQKTEERVTDKNGKQLRRFIYAYDAKGLRKEKRTYDANNVLIVTKKIAYTFK